MTMADPPRIGDYVEIVQATHAATGVRGRLTRIDHADPVGRYLLHGDGGLFAWATIIRAVAPTPKTAPEPAPRQGTARAARRRRHRPAG
ncbi:hypothetical protein ACH4TX_41645 [Streptomyces sp. NPDC021098]|uniref:hypothetical protein n=1 Tax=unclassified Streptomyces TaxID=2593676 RepID=UPI003798FD1D